MQYMDNYRPLTLEEKKKKDRERAERDAEMRARNNRMGLAIFQGSWIMAFVCLAIVYLVMGAVPGWRPAEGHRPDALLPTIATLILLTSSWLARSGWRAVTRDDVQKFLSQWMIAIVLSGVFVVIMMTQFFAISPTETDIQYVELYRLMIAYHAIHAVIIGYMMVQVWRYGRAGHYHSDNHWSVEAGLKLQYFVTAALLIFYAVLYLT